MMHERVGGMRPARVLVLTTAAVLLSGFVTSPAHAELRYGYDAAGDQDGNRDSRGDIRVIGATFALGKDTVSLGTTTNEPPQNWPENTFISWGIITSNQTQFSVIYVMQDGKIQSAVLDARNQQVCTAQAKFYKQYADPYVATFPNTCLKSPQSWAINAYMQYQDQTGGATHDTVDTCCEVRNN